MEELFTSFSAALEEDNKLREEVKKITKEIEHTNRLLAGLLQTIHNRGANISDICSTSQSHFQQLAQHYGALKGTLSIEHYFKFRDMWKQYLQQTVFYASLVKWLQTKKLVTLPEIQNLLGLPSEGKPVGVLTVELDDYLIALTMLPNELSRLCVNCVIAENYSLPLTISEFVNELYGGFRLLNLKNDFLRKRFDSMKYDVKKIEEVVYDISVRGLTKKMESYVSVLGI